MRSLFSACALVMMLLTLASGQTTASAGAALKAGRMSDTESIAMWEILKSKGYPSPAELRAKVREKLIVEDRLPHRFQRVELAGVGSIDDTNATLPDMIDKPLKTSNFNELFPEEQRVADLYSVRRRVTDALNGIYTFFGKDLREAFSDTRGVPSARSQYILDQLKDVKINELFAHSWGTEVVYLGIMNGSIIPPKKLVIMGVPDNNEEKWRILAAHTGIEVHVIGFKWDKARLVGEAAMMFKSGLPEDTASLQRLWNEKCGARAGTTSACADPDKFVKTKFDYNLNVTPPKGPKDTFVKETIRRVLDHDRLLYYTYLSNRNLFNKTVVQLEASQFHIIEAEESKILAEALVQARGLIAKARAQAKIAQRDHDERLKRTYADMATRSCANPGSVTQAELNALTDPYDREFVETPPRGLGACAYMAYMSLGRGADAEQLRRNSVQAAPVAAQPEPPPFNPNLPADPQPARTVPGLKFSSQFPLLKDLAVKACNSPAQVSIAPNQIRSSYVYSFDRGNDDRLAAKMSAEMDNCSRQVFNKLIEMIRSNRGSSVDDKWLRDSAARYQAPVYVEPPRSSPPTGCIPGDNSRRNCIACGNKYCP